MVETALYRKWRSQTFADLVGQEHVSRTLLNALAQGRVGHAYLFCGPRGVGKTSIARLLAKAVNCERNGGRGEPCNACERCLEISQGRSLDVIEIDGASNTSVDNIRDLRDKVPYAPSDAPYKIYIIDEVHRLSGSAFDALLKTLEEPPAHAKFIFASTEAHRIPATIRSRCQRFDLRRIPLRETVARLRQICDAEGIGCEPAALELIARTATGSLRDAVSLLDQLRSMSVDGITLADAQALLGLSSDRGSVELARALAERDVAAALRAVDQLTADGADLRQVAADLVQYLRGLLLIRSGSGAAMLDVSDDQRAEMTELAEDFDLAYLVRALKLLNELDLAARATLTPQLPVELALIEAIAGGEPAATGPSGGFAQPVARRAASPRVAATAGSRPAATRPQPPPAPAAPDEPPASAAETVAGASNAAAVAVAPDALNGGGAGRGGSAAGGASGADSGGDGGSPADAGVEPFQQRWRAYIDSLLSDKRFQALMRDSAPQAWDGTTLVVGFPSAFHRDTVGDARHLPRAEESLAEFFGHPIRVRCTLLGKDGARAGGDVIQDPVVKRALSEGAKIKRVVRDEEG